MAHDAVQFFKEKVLGKSEATYAKYRSGLSVVVGYFSSLPLSSWSEVTEECWHELLAYYYLAENEAASQNQLKAVVATIKAFVKWLDKRYGTKTFPIVAAIMQELEPKIHAAIAVWDYYAPASQRRYVPSILQAGAAVLSSIGEQNDGITEGFFQIQKLTSTGMKVQNLEDDAVYEVATPIPLRRLLEKDMLISGIIMKGSGRKQWQLVTVERVFPGEALEYIAFEMVV